MGEVVKRGLTFWIICFQSFGMKGVYIGGAFGPMAKALCLGTKRVSPPEKE